MGNDEGNAPGTIAMHPSEPCKGETGPVPCWPFQGWFSLFSAGFPVPRALHWADLFSPFGANSET